MRRYARLWSYMTVENHAVLFALHKIAVVASYSRLHLSLLQHNQTFK
jgi:hypothetical protein